MLPHRIPEALQSLWSHPQLPRESSLEMSDATASCLHPAAEMVAARALQLLAFRLTPKGRQQPHRSVYDDKFLSIQSTEMEITHLCFKLMY